MQQSPKQVQRARKAELEQPTVKKVRLEDIDDHTKSTLLNEESLNGINSFSKTLIEELRLRPKLPSLNDLNISSILSKPSLRERFQNTCLDDSKLLAQSRHKDLIEVIELIDQKISFMTQRDVHPFFTNIQEQIKETLGKTVYIQQVQQVLTVWQEAYTLSWRANEKLNGRQDLSLKFNNQTFLSSEELQARKQKFRRALIDHIREIGDHIQEQALPPHPQNNTVKSTQNTIFSSTPAKYDTCGRVNLSKYKLPIENIGISASLLTKFREIKQNQPLPTPTKSVECDSKHLNKVATVIYNYYILRNVSNMFLNNVIQYVIEHNCQYIFDQAQVRKAIDVLLAKCPQWIMLVDNKEGPILRLNKNVEFSTICTQIAF